MQFSPKSKKESGNVVVDLLIVRARELLVSHINKFQNTRLQLTNRNKALPYLEIIYPENSDHAIKPKDRPKSSMFSSLPSLLGLKVP
jgi:hypothetical protein